MSEIRIGEGVYIPVVVEDVTDSSVIVEVGPGVSAVVPKSRVVSEPRDARDSKQRGSSSDRHRMFLLWETSENEGELVERGAALLAEVRRETVTECVRVASSQIPEFNQADEYRRGQFRGASDATNMVRRLLEDSVDVMGKVP